MALPPPARLTESWAAGFLPVRFMKIRFFLAAVVALVSAELRAQMFVVSAYANSSLVGTGVSTVSLTAGQNFVVAVNTDDLWNAGALPRWSNADGLVADLYATGSDESGYAAGTKIGQSFGTWTQDGFTAPYGALVGKLGTDYMLLGTFFQGVASTSGTLELFYWDENNFDNSQFITATIRVGQAPVPEPSTYGLLGAAALAGIAALRRRKLAK
jgi:hypothetical protein